jgi:2,3,4,5-tetrahydropyridine-2-carboxylate N-succinyltransferase
VAALIDLLAAGAVRAAEPAADGGFTVHAWVKLGILLAFRSGIDRPVEVGSIFRYRDRDTLPTWSGAGGEGAPRVVPGGTSIRHGAHLGRGVVVMPPSFVNVGAYIGARSMIDSHVLVGSCAQIGREVHLSAGVQIGGVLEPVGALPVIVEDGAFVGGGCGIFEGVRVAPGAVLAPGVVLTRAVPVIDLVRGQTVREVDGVLAIPPGAVVVPGTRPASGPYARAQGIQLQTPVIVKYRDGDTAAAVAIEQALR